MALSPFYRQGCRGAASFNDLPQVLASGRAGYKPKPSDSTLLGTAFLWLVHNILVEGRAGPQSDGASSCLAFLIPGALQRVFLFFFFLNIYLFIYLFLAVLGLRFCARAFSSCGERGPLFIAVRGPLTITASLVAEHRLQTRRLSSCGARAQLLRGMWDLPRPGLERVSPALAGRFSTTAPPGKPKSISLLWSSELAHLGS